jgi:hypothetical protein
MILGLPTARSLVVTPFSPAKNPRQSVDAASSWRRSSPQKSLENAMSDNAHPIDTPVPATPELFAAAEVQQFEQADAEAGTHIAKMLSTLFLYTVFVMALSTAVTIYWSRS